jgi:ABC-type uncharacterized transport system substrate-binding protein
VIASIGSPVCDRVAIFVGPANGRSAEATLREVPGAARAMGMQIRILNVSTIGEIQAAFGTLAHERPDALFVVPDNFRIASRRPRRDR